MSKIFKTETELKVFTTKAFKNMFIAYELPTAKFSEENGIWTFADKQFDTEVLYDRLLKNKAFL
jgi:hypothetical protein